MLLEEATKPKDPLVVGHDNVYATDNGATLFKVETLARQDDDGITTSEIIGYIILVFLMILLFIMFVRAIIKIKQICGQDTSMFNLDRLQKKSESGQERASYKSGSPENVQASSPSMEKTFEDLNNSSIFNPTTSPGDQALEDAIKKARENYATLSSIKQNSNLPGI